jgi:hypothetical protein
MVFASRSVNLRFLSPDPNFNHHFPPSNRAGKNSTARNNANTAPIVIPTNRRGSETSQTTGNNTSASNATGQHNTNKMHHPTKRTKAFMLFPFFAL